MRFTVVGAGAIGGTFGAHLARAGHEVLLCDADAEHVAAIRRDGLRITGPVADFTVRVPAMAPDHLPADGLGTVLLATKSHHTASAAALLAGRGFDDVVSLQNGLTSGVIEAAVGPGRLVVSFVNVGADVVAPGVVAQGNIATVRIGEIDGPITDRVRRIADALPWAQATDSVTGYLWAKEAYGAMLFGTALCDLSIADALAEPRYREVWLGLAREVLERAPVAPLGFDGFDPADLPGSLERLVVFNRASAKSHSGVYRDLAVRHRRTEVDDLLAVCDGPLTTAVGALVHAIEEGERTCEVANLELLAAIEVTERLGRPLRAVVAVVPAPARAADGPLLGTPVAVKDMVDVAGLVRGDGNPAAAGSGSPAERDAVVVARLRAAGADVFATTTLLEYAAGAPHPDLPEALNPRAPGRSAGGSSGGSAALVAAGACRVALGTDTGGSIRLPAAYCGVVGVKPSHGLVPTDGVSALSPSLDTVGVLAATVADTARVLAVMAGDPALTLDAAPGAPGTRGAPGAPGAGQHRSPAGLRVGVLTGQLASPHLDPELAALTRAALERLQAAGAVLVDVDDTVLAELGDLLAPILLPEAWAVHGRRVTDEPGHYGEPTLRLFRAAGRADPAEGEAALARRDALLPVANALLDGVDVLVGPAAPFAAPLLTPPIDTAEGEVEGVFSSPFNVTGQPAAVLPAGVCADGRPVGVQVVGRLGGDAALLRACAVIEQVLSLSPVT